MTPSVKLDQSIVGAAEILIEFNEKNGVETTNKSGNRYTSKMSIVKSPNGEVVVVVSGPCSNCLHDWYNDHSEVVLDHQFFTPAKPS